MQQREDSQILLLDIKPKIYAFTFVVGILFLSGCATTGRPPVYSAATLPQARASNLTPAQISSEREHIFFGYPSFEEKILYREGYVLSHNKNIKVARWASYHLKDSYISNEVERSDKFKADPDLPKGERAELLDYVRSSYDRGHLVPADDMKRNATTMAESFYLSNMTPQAPRFNQIIWKALEGKVQKWARQRKSIDVITGPIFKTSPLKTIGVNRVAVPTHFYKIVLSGDNPGNLDSIAFVVPNEDAPVSELPQYITSINEIEKLTSLDFLNELDDTAEERIESKKSTIW